MHYPTVWMLLALASQATAKIITSTLTEACVYWSNPIGPTVTQTIPGVTTSTFDAAATTTETASVIDYGGYFTITEQPATATPAPRMAARELTIVETDVCDVTETVTVYPTATYTDPQLTATITSYGYTTVTTTTVTE